MNRVNRPPERSGVQPDRPPLPNPPPPMKGGLFMTADTFGSLMNDIREGLESGRLTRADVERFLDNMGMAAKEGE